MAWKRLATVGWVIGYTVFIGLPVWWVTTSLERPQLPTASQQPFQPLPVAFHVYLVSSGPQHDTPRELAPSLQVDAEQAFRTGAKTAGHTAPRITVDVHSMHAPELASTSPPSKPPSDEDLHKLRKLQDTMSKPANAPSGHFNILLLTGTAPNARKAASTSLDATVWLGPHREAWMWLPGDSVDEPARCALRALFQTILHGASDSGSTGRQSGYRRLPMSAASELTAIFTLAVAEPPLGAADWNLERAAQVIWSAIRDRLSPLVSLRVETQQRLFARGRLLNHHTPPEPSGNASGVRLSEAEIPFFVDSDAWALEAGRIVAGHAAPMTGAPTRTHVVESRSSSPPSQFSGQDGDQAGEHSGVAGGFHGVPETLLHFVGYVPATAEQPMVVDCGGRGPGGTYTGFTVEEWGGVVLLNNASYSVLIPTVKPVTEGDRIPEQASGTSIPEQASFLDSGYRVLYPERVAEYFGLAIQQFREMLGLPPAQSAPVATETCKGRSECSGTVYAISPGSSGVAEWEVDLLMRQRFIQLMTETNAAIKSLQQLVATLDNLEIPRFIGHTVRTALHHASMAASFSSTGAASDLPPSPAQPPACVQALAAARQARMHAEVAQSHHTIATHHRYPPQHKVAMYLPLFAPLSLPLLITLLRELKRKVLQLKGKCP